MNAPIALIAMLAIAAADDDRSLTIITSKSLPPIESVSIYSSAEIKPGKARPKAVRTIALKKNAEAKAKLGAGPYHVYAKPRGGLEVLVLEKLAIPPGKTHELKLTDHLGVVDVFQKDDFPKVSRIVLTAPDDPGPDEKGHVAVQVGSDYREEMAVPDGFYAVWLVPANGVRARRIEDRIRVLPGKIVRIGN
ncbi:MAG TPA: hypothetical protein VN641_03170 [Urbifossiella sp.]|nr:hypothetical protein [Urbifossiella sp.]